MSQPANHLWDYKYSNSLYIENYKDYVNAWSENSNFFRENCTKKSINVAYGEADRHVYDIFYSKVESNSVVIFIHGGCWMDFSKSDWSFLAEGSTNAGWNFSVPSYTLCPESDIGQITVEIANAIATIASKFNGDVILVGHSAGAHLAARMMCSDSLLEDNLIARIRKIIAISGIYDLRPFLYTEMNKTIGLNMEEAKAQSPVFHAPIATIPLILCIGSDELPDFHRQSNALFNLWKNLGADVVLHTEPDKHHFNVIEPLAQIDSKLIQLVLA